MAGLRAASSSILEEPSSILEEPSSILWGGLRLVLASPGALLWTYTFNVGLAFLFSLRLHAEMASILNHSLAAERLSSAFDLGTLLELRHALTDHVPASGASGYAGLPLYLAVYFVLVPGALFTYRTQAPGRLSILLGTGLGFFWRFLRITLLAAIVFAAVLTPLLAAQSAWASHVDERFVGAAAFWLEVPGLLLIVLVAALLRLYFDLVEVYTVQLNDHLLPNGKTDRRVRRVLGPALRTLAANFGRAYGTFLGLALLGTAALAATWAEATELLAQRHVLPIFLLTQLGLLVSLLTRFWQRGAQTVLASDNRLAADTLSRPMTTSYSQQEAHWAQTGALPKAQTNPQPAATPDAQSDPEPAVPSLEQPDPGVFHHEPPPLDPVEP